MPPRWLNPRNPYFFFPTGILILTACLNIFPDPPAVQEAEARKWALAKQRREEEYERAMEQRIEKFERENPGVFDRKWKNDDEEQDRD